MTILNYLQRCLNLKKIPLLSLVLCTNLNALNYQHQTAVYMEQIKDSPKLLSEFIQAMPKGGDLHNHLSGASYAENLLRYAKDEKFCFSYENMSVSKDVNCHSQNFLDEVIKDSQQRDKIIDAWSMRNFSPNSSENSDQHFFATFSKFGAISSAHKPEMLAEVVARAGENNELYMEIMLRADSNLAKEIGQKVVWENDFDAMWQKLHEAGIDQAVIKINENLEKFTQEKDRLLQCKIYPKEGCDVTVRYIHEVLRDYEPAQVFSQMLASFKAAATNPNIAGVNLVQAENGSFAFRDYDLHMDMMAYFHKRYPKVHFSLHAGELTHQIVPQENLESHIRKAIEVGHAERIGHGVDILDEADADELLSSMANKHIPVEINLSSNDYILHLSGVAHPFHTYLTANVPLTLSTDDEGVNRSNITGEYTKAVQEQQLNYQQLKTISRNSLQYAFLPGTSLFEHYDYNQIATACKGDEPGSLNPSKTCKEFLDANQKAALQWQLEQRFNHFESNWSKR